MNTKHDLWVPIRSDEGEPIGWEKATAQLDETVAWCYRMKDSPMVLAGHGPSRFDSILRVQILMLDHWARNLRATILQRVRTAH